MTLEDIRQSTGSDIRIYKSTKTIVVQSINPLKLVGRFGRFYGIYRNKSAKSLSELINGFIRVLEDVVKSNNMGGWSHDLLQMLIDCENIRLDTVNQSKIFDILPDMKYVHSIRVVVPKDRLFEIVNTFYTHKNFDLTIGGKEFKPGTIYINISPYNEFYADVIFNKKTIMENIMDKVIEKSIKIMKIEIKKSIVQKRAFDYYYNRNPSLLAKLLWIFGKQNDAICEAQSNDTSFLNFLVCMLVLFILGYPIFVILDWVIQNLGMFSEPISGILIRLIALILVFIGFLLVYEEEPFLDPAIREFEKDTINKYLNDLKDEILKIVLEECRKLTKGVGNLSPRSLSKAKFKRIEELIEVVVDKFFDKPFTYTLGGV
jgi:hypothetical protein